LKHDVCPELPTARDGAVRLTGLAGLATFVARAEPELAANAMLCATNQAAYLLRRQVESQARDFLKNGGFTENLYAARKKARAAQEAQKSDQSDQSDSSDRQVAPTCPKCGAPMRLRHARKGPRAGGPFWGCTRYPECVGLREADANRV
jgi:four helix bundle suffix protein